MHLVYELNKAYFNFTNLIYPSNLFAVIPTYQISGRLKYSIRGIISFPRNHIAEKLGCMKVRIFISNS